MQVISQSKHTRWFEARKQTSEWKGKGPYLRFRASPLNMNQSYLRRMGECGGLGTSMSQQPIESQCRDGKGGLTRGQINLRSWRNEEWQTCQPTMASRPSDSAAWRWQRRFARREMRHFTCNYGNKKWVSAELKRPRATATGFRHGTSTKWQNHHRPNLLFKQKPGPLHWQHEESSFIFILFLVSGGVLKLPECVLFVHFPVHFFLLKVMFLCI